MLALVLALTVAIAGAPESTAVCSRDVVMGFRPFGATALSLRATTDSVLDDRLPPMSDEPGRSYIVRAQREQVYGQVFTVTSVSGSNAHYWGKRRSVVLVWWRLGMGCTHHPPQGALHPRVRELFIAPRPSVRPTDFPSDLIAHRALAAELRSPDHWINGIPTVDVQWDVDRYSPELRQVLGTAGTGLPNMTVAEYAELYPYFPEEGPTMGDIANARRLLDASLTRAQWWEKYPSLGFLCNAWSNVREGPARMRELAARKCR